ncbi:hypothetical protein EOD04_29160, partial [Mesorhizobium sp. M2C.T.Ca.TU.009.01.2.1]
MSWLFHLIRVREVSLIVLRKLGIRRRSAKAVATANLPPCGGDARQGREGCCPASLSVGYMRGVHQFLRPKSRTLAFRHTPLWPAGHLP